MASKLFYQSKMKDLEANEKLIRGQGATAQLLLAGAQDMKRLKDKAMNEAKIAENADEMDQTVATNVRMRQEQDKRKRARSHGSDEDADELKGSETSSLATDEGLKDDEVTLESIDEETGQKIERKTEVGFDKLHQQRMLLIDKAHAIVK